MCLSDELHKLKQSRTDAFAPEIGTPRGSAVRDRGEILSRTLYGGGPRRWLAKEDTGVRIDYIRWPSAVIPRTRKGTYETQANLPGDDGLPSDFNKRCFFRGSD